MRHAISILTVTLKSNTHRIVSACFCNKKYYTKNRAEYDSDIIDVPFFYSIKALSKKVVAQLSGCFRVNVQFLNFKKNNRKHVRAAETTRSYNGQIREAYHYEAFRPCSRLSSGDKRILGGNQISTRYMRYRR